MFRFIGHSLRRRLGRAFALMLGIAVASLGFVLLTGSTRTTSIKLHGTLKTNFRAAYDILVRPKDSYTPLERQRSLVRANYLAGLYGGITLADYRRVAAIQGVEVAAPIANVGTVTIPATVTIPLRGLLSRATDQIYRVDFSWRSQGGLSHYPGTTEYIYVTHRQFEGSPPSTISIADPVSGKHYLSCDGFDAVQPVMKPFVPRNSTQLACFSTSLSPSARSIEQQTGRQFDARGALAAFYFQLPVNVAAIDPAAEAKLVGLSDAVVRGRYLRAVDGIKTEWLNSRVALNIATIPVLAASSSFVGDSLTAKIERLAIPNGANVPALLGAGACPPPLLSCEAAKQERGPSESRSTAYDFVSSLRGTPIARKLIPAGEAWTAALDPRRTKLAQTPQYWRSEATRYRRLSGGGLQPIPTRNPDSVWLAAIPPTGYVQQPTDNLDTQFRKLHNYSALGGAGQGQLIAPFLRVVGVFNPSRLREFSSLSRLPLETYYPPLLSAADRRTSRLLHGSSLAPSQNVADYIQQPPLLLTTFKGLSGFLSSDRFQGVSPRERTAPISAIRVRVKGVDGLDSLSLLRIRTVAAMIRARTGLDVDVTAGSSPTPIKIALPAGHYGRPQLSLLERWSAKGVAVSYLRAVDRKDIALYALILLVCAAFLMNGALAATYARRAEIGTLMTFGWGRNKIIGALLGEMLFIGLVAGILSAAVGVAVVAAFSLAVPAARVLLVIPIAATLAVLGALPAAAFAAARLPLDPIRPQTLRSARSFRARGFVSLSVASLLRLPSRALLGGFGCALAVAALTVVYAVQLAFRGVLVTSALGSAITFQVRPADYIAIALTIALGAISAADALYISLRERVGEVAALRAVGWTNRQLARMFLTEVILLAATASLIGAVIGILIGAAVFAIPVGELALAGLGTALVAVISAAIASLVPITQVLSRLPAAVLSAE